MRVRKMEPPVPEVIDEIVFDVVEVQHRGETRRRNVPRLTGKRIDTGSRLAVDTRCGDCGTSLVPLSDLGFSYLACGRLNLPVSLTRSQPTGRWLPKVTHDGHGSAIVEWEHHETPEVTTGSVLECEGWRPE